MHKGSKAEQTIICTRRKWHPQSAVQWKMPVQIRNPGGPRQRTAHATVWGQGLWLVGNSMAEKNGQGSQFNNSRSAPVLHPWSFDFYKLTIQATREHENNSTGKACNSFPGFLWGFQMGRLGMHSLLPTQSPRGHSVAKCTSPQQRALGH